MLKLNLLKGDDVCTFIVACGETTLISGSTGRTCTGVRLRLERFILDTFCVFRSNYKKSICDAIL